MKKLNKVSASILSIILLIVLAVACFFTFVPFNCGSKDYLSFLGNMSVSTDLKDGLFAEYEITSISSDKQVENAIAKMRNMLADKGFINSKVFRKGEDFIRVEVKGPNVASNLSSYEDTLKVLGAGIFELRGSSDEDALSVINGCDHVKSVEVKSYSSEAYVVLINLNNAGKIAYKQLTTDVLNTEESSIYMFVGDEGFPSSSSNSFKIEEVSTTGVIQLTFNSSESADSFANYVRAGSLDVELNGDTVVIGDISPLDGGSVFTFSLIALLVIVIAWIIVMIVLFGMNGMFVFVCTLINAVITIILLQAMPWVEIDLSSIFAIFVGFVIINLSSVFLFNKIKSEYALGKTIDASIDSAWKNNKKYIIDSACLVGIIGFFVAIIGISQLQTMGTIFVITALLSLLTNFVLIRFLFALYTTMFKITPKRFRLVREDNVDEIK